MNISISGPSGVGKTTVIEVLTKNPRYIWHPSYTTRAMRAGEVDGEDYHFIDHATWQHIAHTHDWILSTEYDGHYYGYRASALQHSMRATQCLILNIDQPGARELRDFDPHCINILMLADPVNIRQRLELRGEPKNSPRYHMPDNWDRSWYHYCVINDVVEQCAARIDLYIKHRMKNLQ